jgi:hypothetical protein
MLRRYGYIFEHKVYNFTFNMQIATVKAFVMYGLWLDNLFIEAATH